MFSITGSSVLPGYAKVTFSNARYPCVFVSVIPFSFSVIEGLVSNISWIRLAETAALGYIVKILANIINEKSAWKIYSIKATKLPTCKSPAFISIAPSQITIAKIQLNTIEKIGIAKAISLNSFLETVI